MNNNIKRILELLDSYIEENRCLKEEYEEKITLKGLYDDLLLLLNGEYDEMKENNVLISILFTTIYKNDIYEMEYYRILNRLQGDKSNKQEINRFINIIKKDASKVEKDIDEIVRRRINSKNMLSSAYRVRLNLKHKKPILESKYDILNVSKIISYYELKGVIDNRDVAILVNEIELYNRRLMANATSNKMESVYTEELYEKIPNIIYGGFQLNDEIVIDTNRKDTIDKFKDEIISALDNLDNDDMVKFIEGYRNYNLTNNEYNYIIVGIMDNYLTEVLCYYEFLMDTKIVLDKKQRLEVVKDYYSILDKYLYIKEYYENINSCFVEEVSNEIEEDNTIQSNGEVREIIYARSQVNPLKSYLIMDMDDMPNEYYDTVYDLIDRFKNNKIINREIKALSRGNKDYASMELLHDQVRIIFRHVRDNIYCILGVFAKKATNKMTIYDKITNRSVPDISTIDKYEKEKELSEYNNRELEEKVAKEARKGTR